METYRNFRDEIFQCLWYAIIPGVTPPHHYIKTSHASVRIQEVEVTDVF
jgi:hypothetical protein